MATEHNTHTNGTSPRKSILNVSLSLHLTGHPISLVIATDWEKNRNRAADFDNIGFDVDYDHFDKSVQDLRQTLQKRDWNGVLIGWCLRGKPDHTVMFERVVGACHEELRSKPETKIMFSTGPDNLVETVMRNFE